MAKPKVQGREGIGEWLHLPATIAAPSPENRNVTCIYGLSTTDPMKLAMVGRREPIFELWSVVLGLPPPVPGVHHRNRPVAGELTSLADAHALFRGIERPLADDDDGENVFAYVLRPRLFYEYDPNMVSVALKSPVPTNLVFVTFVRLGIAAGDGSRMVRGVVTHWQFVEADETDPELPVNHATRYRTRLW